MLSGGGKRVIKSKVRKDIYMYIFLSLNIEGQCFLWGRYF